MDRRDLLRLLATGAALQFAPRNLLFAMREARNLLGSPTALRTLNPQQEATLKVMADLILPQTDTPGAAEAGAIEFIDLMLTEWYGEAERSLFLRGLADLDSRTRGLFGKGFAECTVSQQSDILIHLGKQMSAETKGLRKRHIVESTRAESFYHMLRHLTLTAYYTSEAGATAELHYEVIPERHQGCDAISGDKTSSE